VDGEVDVAAVAGLIGEPARAKVLVALADGRALAASTLAAEASVAASTISEHLARLVDGGLVAVEPSGRHRYYRLASPGVADVLEALARLAPAAPVRSLRQATRARAIRSARICYDHLAGRLGVALCDALVEQEIVLAEPRDYPCGEIGGDPVLGAGRALRFELTATGRHTLAELGVALEPPRRRRTAGGARHRDRKTCPGRPVRRPPRPSGALTSGGADGVLIASEAGFLKKGTKSAGCSGSTRERRAGRRIARSGCSWPTRRRWGMR
jgi:DNA-binding transcriptional ArsR family regulator